MARIGYHPVIGQNGYQTLGAEGPADVTYLGMTTNKLSMVAAGIGAVMLLLAFMKRRKRSRASAPATVSVPAAPVSTTAK